jgi:hypothetical protein
MAAASYQAIRTSESRQEELSRDETHQFRDRE